MKKENFLALLTNVSPEELNKIIQEKGKEPKKITPIIFVKEDSISNKS